MTKSSLSEKNRRVHRLLQVKVEVEAEAQIKEEGKAGEEAHVARVASVAREGKRHECA